MFLAVP
jgi:hypothetical protein